MFAVAVNALYTTLRRRGTTRQLAGAIVTCVISALLLLPALVWYNMRFSTEQAVLSVAEVEVALVYVALWGWFLPLSVTVAYCLFTLPRTSTSSVQIPRQKRITRINASTAATPPRHQPGVPAPFVFNEDTPWGWLEYRGGRFQGQRLALKRVVVTIGREEDNDVWLDDDMASRYHAELVWDQGRVYVSDCGSLNGVLVNGKRILSSTTIEQGGLLEIGSHRFLFEHAELPDTVIGQDDPLSRHVWRPSMTTASSDNLLPVTKPLEDIASPGSADFLSHPPPSTPDQAPIPDQTTIKEWQDTAQLNPISPIPRSSDLDGAFVIRDGAMAGQSFLLDRPVLTIGRGSESDIVINDASISRRHAQVLRQANGNYMQDLSSSNGSKVNNEPLHTPRLLQFGDVVCLGSIHLEYVTVQTARTAPLPLIITPPPLARPISGPIPLRLPSKPKKE